MNLFSAPQPKRGPLGGSSLIGTKSRMISIGHCVLVLLGAVALARPMAAQTDSATLYVHVADSTGSPLAEAFVLILSRNSRDAQVTGTTNLHGQTRVRLAPGKYEVIIRRIGFSPTRDTVVVTSGRSDSLRVRLQSDPLTIARLNEDRMLNDTSQPHVAITRESGRPSPRCVGTDSLIVQRRSVTVTGYRSSPVTPADVFGTVFRRGTLLVLDLFDDHPSEIGAMVSCIRWRAVITGLPEGSLLLVVRHMEESGTSHLLARPVDTRSASAVALAP